MAEVALEDAAATPQGAAVALRAFVLATEGLHRHRGPQGHSASRHSRPKRRLQAAHDNLGELNPNLTVEGGAEGLPRPRPLKQDHCAAFHYEVCPPAWDLTARASVLSARARHVQSGMRSLAAKEKTGAGGEAPGGARGRGRNCSCLAPSVCRTLSKIATIEIIQEV